MVAVNVVVNLAKLLALVSRSRRQKARYSVQGWVGDRALLAGESDELHFAFRADVHVMRFREQRVCESAE